MDNKAIISVNDDGCIAVTYPKLGREKFKSDKEYDSYIIKLRDELEIPGYKHVEIKLQKDLPKDRSNRNEWRHEDGKIKANGKEIK